MALRLSDSHSFVGFSGDFLLIQLFKLNWQSFVYIQLMKLYLYLLRHISDILQLKNVTNYKQQTFK